MKRKNRTASGFPLGLGDLAAVTFLESLSGLGLKAGGLQS